MVNFDSRFNQSNYLSQLEVSYCLQKVSFNEEFGLENDPVSFWLIILPFLWLPLARFDASFLPVCEPPAVTALVL